MTIYSWNMLFRNKRLPEALAFIRDSGADIFCLQEVPGEAVARLADLPYHYAEVKEVDLVYRGREGSSHLAILSRYPIEQHAVIEHSLPPIPPFARLMYAFGLWALARGGQRQAFYADIRSPRGIIRIFNLHLPLQAPHLRAQEFEHAMTHREPSLPAIVCGDFNILEKPHITTLNWLMGSHASDTFLWRRERLTVERRFAAYELRNPLRGKHTHPFSKSQLDHILVSPEFSIERAEVVRERHGSDHHPIRVELASRGST